MRSAIPKNSRWPDRNDLAVRILSPEMAAEKLGWTVAAVTARRTELGLGQFVGRKKGRTNRQPKKKVATKQRVKLKTAKRRGTKRK